MVRQKDTARSRNIKPEDKKLAAQIRKLRTERNLTQEELANRMGTNPSYIAYIETGRRGMSLPMVYRVAKVLGVSVSELFTF